MATEVITERRTTVKLKWTERDTGCFVFKKGRLCLTEDNKENSFLLTLKPYLSKHSLVSDDLPSKSLASLSICSGCVAAALNVDTGQNFWSKTVYSNDIEFHKNLRAFHAK